MVWTCVIRVKDHRYYWQSLAMMVTLHLHDSICYLARKCISPAQTRGSQNSTIKTAAWVYFWDHFWHGSTALIAKNSKIVTSKVLCLWCNSKILLSSPTGYKTHGLPSTLVFARAWSDPHEKTSLILFPNSNYVERKGWWKNGNSIVCVKTFWWNGSINQLQILLQRGKSMFRSNWNWKNLPIGWF